MCQKSLGGLRFDLRSLLQGRMWSFIPLMVYISLIIGRIGLGCEDESFGGTTFDIIFCMSRFNRVPTGDTLCQDAISSCLLFVLCYSLKLLLIIINIQHRNEFFSDQS